MYRILTCSLALSLPLSLLLSLSFLSQAKAVFITVDKALGIVAHQITEASKRLKEVSEGNQRANHRKDRAGGRTVDSTPKGEWRNARVTETPQIVSLRERLAALESKRVSISELDPEAELCIGWVAAPAAGLRLAFTEGSRLGYVDPLHHHELTETAQWESRLELPHPTPLHCSSTPSTQTHMRMPIEKPDRNPSYTPAPMLMRTRLAP